MDFIPKYVKGKNNPDTVSYTHPALVPILKDTYGCIVYQEQVIEIFRKIAGFSLGQADLIRRAMSKKIKDVIEREKKAFIEGDPERNISGAVANGVSKTIASRIYDDIYAFADYAFVKSHSAAYAIISYQTAYLKCHYPQIYMAALMSSILGSRDAVAVYTESCRQMGINLLPPDINKSGANFTVSGDDLRYGLMAVKNIGRGLINALVSEREKNGDFLSFEDFCKRLQGNELNSRAALSLIKCGCFDNLGANRRQLIICYESILKEIADDKRRNIEGQMNLFTMSGNTGQNVEESAILSKYQDFEEYPKNELLRMEREVTGLYLSGHPMDEYRDIIKKAGVVQIADILSDFSRETGNIKFTDNQNITVVGIIESVRTKQTRNNTTMAYIELDDGFGTIELLAFQRAIDECGTYMLADNAVIVTGRLSARDETEPQIVVDSLRLLDNHPIASHHPSKEENKPKTLYVKLQTEDSDDYDLLRITHKNFAGHEPMIIYFADTKKTVKGTCKMHERFIKSLKEMLGDENVIIK